MSKHDQDSPELTEAWFKKAKPAKDVLPTHLHEELTKKRGPQKKPTKTAVSIRLSDVVLEHYRTTGTGWQTRLDNDLKKLHKLQ